MNIVVSILNWNGFSSTLRCLASLNHIKHDQLIICVTDNGSTEFDATALTQRYEHVRVFKNAENLGYAGGHLNALQFARSTGAELFWMLNNDTLVESATLTNLIIAYQSNGIGVYGSAPKAVNDEPMSELIWGIDQRDATKCDFTPIPHTQLSDGKTHKVSNVVGFSLLVPLQMVSDHGFMDDSYFLYYEETDYCLRLLSHGIASYWVGSSQVVHEKQGSSKGNTKLEEVMEYYLYRNLFLLLRRWGSARLIAHFFRRFMMRFLSANVLGRKKVFPLTKKHLMGLYHALIGRRGQYYKPKDYLK